MPPAFPLVALVILDGWGIAPAGPGNAVELAATPVFDDLRARFPTTTLAASGEAVGLPAGQMGNSEVGHLTIGAGRVVDQDLMRIDRAVESGAFFENPALTAAFDRAAARGGAVHLLGLVSRGGVHSQFGHLLALVELGRQRGLGERTLVHAFTDGRDVSPTAAAGDLRELVGQGVRIATVAGRYYAMDRDGRWDRTDRALRAIVDGEGPQIADPVAAVEAGYGRGVTDEFIEPLVVEGMPGLSHDDTAIFFNFRPDRARQLSQRLLEAGYDLTTMTRYRDDFACPVAFEEQVVSGTLAEVIAKRGLRQLHIAETEKYAHVTYFLNGGREQEWPGETRILVPSPRDVATYDLKPEMSAPIVADRFVEAVRGSRLHARRRQLRQPGHGGPLGRRSGRSRRRRGRRRLPRARRRGGARAGGGVPRLRRPRQRRAAAGGRRRQPPHRSHDEPGAVDRHVSRSLAAVRRRARRRGADVPRAAGDRARAGDDGHRSDGLSGIPSGHRSGYTRANSVRPTSR